MFFTNSFFLTSSFVSVFLAENCVAPQFEYYAHQNVLHDDDDDDDDMTTLSLNSLSISDSAAQPYRNSGSFCSRRRSSATSAGRGVVRRPMFLKTM